jgi:hypothetical protein
MAVKEGSIAASEILNLPSIPYPGNSRMASRNCWGGYSEIDFWVFFSSDYDDLIGKFIFFPRCWTFFHYKLDIRL